ncbi:MAG: hypothetical protein ACK4E0_14350 [Chitinophagaceae bacterium]
MRKSEGKPPIFRCPAHRRSGASIVAEGLGCSFPAHGKSYFRTMKNFERIPFFYFIGLLLFAIVLMAFGFPLLNILSTVLFWLLPAIFAGLGFLLGGAVYELVMKPARRKRKIFLWAHSIGLLLFLVPFSILFYVHRNSETDIANSDANHSFLSDFFPDTTRYMWTAVNKLESTFLNPDDFKLRSFSSRQRDTLVNGITDSVFSVYFEYQHYDKAEPLYLSRIDVFRNSASLLLFNADPKENEEYQLWRMQNRKQLNNSMQEAMETLRKIVKAKDQQSIQ